MTKTALNIIVFVVTMVLSSASYACHDTHEPPGGEIVCPAEERPDTQDLKEKGLGLTKMQIIDELECNIKETHEQGWCEFRKADDNPLIYIIIYSNQERDMIRLILILNPKTKESVVFYDSEKRRDI